MASSTSKSRPLARSYVSTPGLRQQRFDSRCRAVKGGMGGTPDTSKADARRQNTLTQMDFVRLGFPAALEDDGLDYLEYEPMVKQEEEKPLKAVRTTREALPDMPVKASGSGKRKRETRRAGVEQAERSGDWTEDDEAEEYTRTTHRSRKSTGRSCITNDPPRPPRASQRTSSIEGKESSTPRLESRERDLVDYNAKSIKRERDEETTSLSNSSANTPRRAMKSNTETKARTPLQSMSANPRVSAFADPMEHSAKRPAFHIPPVPRRADRREVLPLPSIHTSSDLETVPVAEGLPDAASLPSPVPQQAPTALDITDRHNLRYSDPGLTIPDSEDEDETQDTKLGPSTSPTMLRVGRLASQKSFSQATTVDSTQCSQRLPPTQPSLPLAKPVASLSDTKITPNRVRRSNFLPPPSSLGSNTSAHGDNSACPITESQLLPDSLMHFELPRLPGWSQNSEEAEETCDTSA